MNMPHKPNRPAFSLVEVVLAIGILSLAVVALLGLFGPTIGSVKQVVDTNLATAAVSRINAEIQNGMTWEEALNATNGGYIFYVWKRQDAPTASNPNPPVTFHMSEGNTAGSEFSADGNVDGKIDSSDPKLTDDLRSGNLVDTPLIVTFDQGMQGGSNGYSFDKDEVAKQGYFPIEVSIYPLEAGLTLDGNNDKAPYSGITDVQSKLDPVFTYTTAKTRSL